METFDVVVVFDDNYEPEKVLKNVTDYFYDGKGTFTVRFATGYSAIFNASRVKYISRTFDLGGE